MKPIRWSLHAVNNLAAREIERKEAELTLTEPEFVVLDDLTRQVLMRRYFDKVLHQEMLLRIIVEETIFERVVVTIYKTSQIHKYLKGLVP